MHYSLNPAELIQDKLVQLPIILPIVTQHTLTMSIDSQPESVLKKMEKKSHKILISKFALCTVDRTTHLQCSSCNTGHGT